MSDQPTPPNPGQPRELNLQQMANQFMAGVQRHFDMLAFNLATRGLGSENTYNELISRAGVMPVPQLHQNFEQMQAHARDLLLRQVINDALNLTVTCLNNTHLFLALIKEKRESGGNELTQEQQKAAQQAQQEFIKVRLEDKFDRIETTYKVMCELEDSIISLAFCLQALVTQGGVVRKAQLGANQQLELELVHAAPSLKSPHNLQPANIRTYTKSFSEEERIIFSDTDLQSVILTVGVFARQLFESVAKYASPEA
ncbi:hypothetical protein G0Q06_00495 [Puniceicoccales bacterium CK1056]|uniref:Uncharacterized protein n=1 Tax=Oceanipulchritudo coccoides TaxID=2706888 RepID=A0A6B2LYD6_9BACT|nr:hypothetical protein [Oceanipulchritudo coccoides]NDV60924.1 hypothetical protein [Oceanipulchritudo coccoides]